MAGLGDGSEALEMPSAASQLGAIGWLRWRLLVNGFRRKGGKAELVARVLLYPFALLLVLVPILGAGGGSYLLVHTAAYGNLPGVFWAAFLLQVVISINISPPALSFDPEALIRFPLPFGRYLLVRLALGLLSASALAGTLTLWAAALGVSLARPALAGVAFAASTLLAASNVLLIRTVFAWVDRWLSTRRAREAVTGLFVVLGLGFQYLNLTFNTGRHDADTAAKLRHLRHGYHLIAPLLTRLPPGLAAAAVQHAAAGERVASGGALLLVLLSAVLFAGLFGWRMVREYRGENLSEVRQTTELAPRLAAAEPDRSFGLPPVVAGCFRKELLYIRRNTTQFYALLVPLVMVFLISSRLRMLAHSGLVFPCAVAYAFLSVSALPYNLFGLDATGVQMYLLAPVPMRMVVLAKNLLGFLINLLEFALLLAITTYLYGAPSVAMALTTLAWLALAALGNTTVGNRRSFTAPKKMDPSKLSRRQASPLSAYLALGLVLICAALGYGLHLLASRLHQPWLPLGVLAPLAVAAGVGYVRQLRGMDHFCLLHREALLEELCKAA